LPSPVHRNCHTFIKVRIIEMNMCTYPTHIHLYNSYTDEHPTVLYTEDDKSFNNCFMRLCTPWWWTSEACNMQEFMYIRTPLWFEQGECHLLVYIVTIVSQCMEWKMFKINLNTSLPFFILFIFIIFCSFSFFAYVTFSLKLFVSVTSILCYKT